MDTAAMNQKLTLRMDKEVIDLAKAYGHAHGKSLSRIVADYFRTLNGEQNNPDLSPKVRGLLGIAKGSKPGIHDYEEYLVRKYLEEDKA